jgi:serine/threonine protein kinase/tetratricopeptide (TPR) repeat protein
MSRPTPEIDEVYFAALERETAEARAAYLDEVCASDPDLRRRVERLLEAQPKMGSFMDSPAAGPTLSLASAEAVEGPGRVIGPYKLLEQIGEGGMGIVYMAEQTEPVRRKVALKIIKPGMDTKQVTARFEAERQALALMDHPSIAKVLDAGMTSPLPLGEGQGEGLAGIVEPSPGLRPDPAAAGFPPLPRGRGLGEGSAAPPGRPYFVMELVKGIPITDYCDQHRLTIAERLRLFTQVCQAVQHAHQKGVIHRDIKPSNVLVTSLDGVPLPKVIDFGVAKAMGHSLTDKTLFTGFAQLIGTPLYMSPEQAELSAVDVDTRSDIYSLGVLLYELLTGTTPFDRDTFRTAALHEVRRIIREQEPPKPSTRLSGLGATSTAVSDNRQTDPRKLNRSLRGELDWIVMKALEKERQRRYETASGLARDVELYLSGAPVGAGPPSPWYRFRKFSRRNRLILTAASLVALVLIAGTAVSVWQAILARRARAEALVRRDEARQAVDDMYTDVAEQWLSQQAALEPMQKKFLEKALNYYQRFAEEAATDAKTRLKTAEAYRRVAEINEKLGNYSDGKSACDRATAILGKLVADGPFLPQYQFEQATCESTMARLLWQLGPQEEAKRLTRQSVARLERVAAAAPAVPLYRYELAKCEILHAWFWRSNFADAEKALLQAIALLDKLAADEPPVALYRSSLAMAYARLGLVLRGDSARSAPAIWSFQREIDLGERLVAESPSVPNYKEALATSLEYFAEFGGTTNSPQEVERLYRRAIELCEKLAADSPSVPAYRQRLAITCGNLGIFFADTTEQRHTRAQRRSFLDSHLIDFGSNEHREQAEKLYRRADGLLEGLSAEFPSAIDYQRLLALGRNNLARLLERVGRLAEAEEVYRSVAAMADKSKADLASTPEFQFQLGTSYLALADIMLQAGRSSDAEKLFRRGIAILKELPGPEPAIELTWTLSTGPIPQLREPQLALKLAKQNSDENPRHTRVRTALGVARYGASDWNAAIEDLERAVQFQGGGDPTNWLFLSMAHCRTGDKDKARPWFNKAARWLEKYRLHDPELRRFYVEAAALMGGTDRPKLSLKEEGKKRQLKP